MSNSRTGSLQPSIRQPVKPVLPGKKMEDISRILLFTRDGKELYYFSACLRDISHLVTAGNERDALRLMERGDIQLVINSLSLTDPDGIQFCRHLKSSFHYSHIPVILLIDKGYSRIEALRSGADACIERPLSGAYLKEHAVNLLANRARIRNYYAHFACGHPGPPLQPNDNEAFLEKLKGLIALHLGNKDLDVDTLARLMNMTRPTFYRKLKRVSGQTPNELVNTARLGRAAELISTTGYKIFEVVKMVGFNSHSNFGKAFLKHFHATPTEYQRRSKSGQQEGGRS